MLEFGSVEAIKQCAMAGMGVAVLLEVAVGRERSEVLLVSLPWWRGGLRMYTHLMWHRERWQPPAVHTFLEEDRKFLGEKSLR